MGIAKRACWVLVLLLDPLLETPFMKDVGTGDNSSNLLPFFQVFQTNNAVVFLKFTKAGVIDPLLCVYKVSVNLFLLLILLLFLPAPSVLVHILLCRIDNIDINNGRSFLLFVSIVHIASSLLKVLRVRGDGVNLGLPLWSH